MSDLTKRLIVAIVIFFLVAFGFNQMLKNQAIADLSPPSSHPNYHNNRHLLSGGFRF